MLNKKTDKCIISKIVKHSSGENNYDIPSQLVPVLS